MADMTALLAELNRPRVNWISGIVTGIDANGMITLEYGGGTITKASRLESYTPVIGDRVEALSYELMGVMILGKNSASTSTPPIVTPQAPVIISPSTRATYGPGPGEWALNELTPGTGKVVCFFYSTGLTGLAGVQLQSVEIELIGVSGSSPSLIGHQNAAPAGLLATVGLPYRPGMLIPASAVWVPLAIGMGQALIAGTIRGIGIVSEGQLGSYTGSGRVRLTPLSVTI